MRAVLTPPTQRPTAARGEGIAVDMFAGAGRRQTPEQIIETALAYNPVAIFALYSGGDDSLKTTHWAMNNIPGCEVAHFNTGIGIEITRTHVRETCAHYGWKLTEIRAKEDCGQDYDEIVLRFGFPGPAGHQLMYRRLKERCVEKLVRDRKTKRSDKVMLITGIRQDESVRRGQYGGSVIDFKGAQMWVKPMYWVSGSDFHHYIVRHELRRNPVSVLLGMSGECLCGAFAKPGELDMVRFVCPKTAARIEDLQARVRAAGHDWDWEDRPPRPPKQRDDRQTGDLFNPLCVSCGKFEEAA